MLQEEVISRTALAGAIGGFIKDIQVRVCQEKVQNYPGPETAPPQGPPFTGPFDTPAFMMLGGSKYRPVNPMFGHHLSGHGGHCPLLATGPVQSIAVPTALSKDTTPPPPPAPPPNTPKRLGGNSYSKDTTPPPPPSPPPNTPKRLGGNSYSKDTTPPPPPSPPPNTPKRLGGNSYSKDTTPPPPPSPPPNTPKRYLGNSLDSKDTTPPPPPAPPPNTPKRIASSTKASKQTYHQSAQQLVEIGKAALASSSRLPTTFAIRSGTSSKDREAPKPAPKPKPGPSGGGPKKGTAELDFISTGTGTGHGGQSHGHGHGHIAAFADSRANPFITYQDKGTKFISTAHRHAHPHSREILKSALKNSAAKGGKKGDMDGFIHTGPVTVPIYMGGGKDGKKAAHARVQFCETASQFARREGRESRRLGIKA